MSHTILLAVTLADDEVEIGWNGDIDEVAESVRAALHEVIGDDGGAYVPTVRVLDPDIFPVPDAEAQPWVVKCPTATRVVPDWRAAYALLATIHRVGLCFELHEVRPATDQEREHQ
jgi:hypothetical protein